MFYNINKPTSSGVEGNVDRKHPSHMITVSNENVSKPDFILLTLNSKLQADLKFDVLGHKLRKAFESSNAG